MPIQSSGIITSADVREEGNKTTWQSPNYPLAGEILDIYPDWALSVDENHQLGYDFGDGSFEHPDWFGWDTWKRPKIEWVYPIQFDVDGGILVMWKVSGGDIFRSGYVIKVGNTAFPASLGTIGILARYAGEFNPSAGNPDRLRYCLKEGDTGLDKEVQALQDSAGWFDYGAWGDFDGVDPSGALLIDPTAGTVEPSAIFACVLNSSSFYGSGADGVKKHYVSIVPVDGRQFHTLGDQPADNEYDVSTNPHTGTDYENFVTGNWKNAEYAPNYFGAGRNPEDGSIILYTDSGTISKTNTTNEGFTFESENFYEYYLSPNNYKWIYITDDLGDLGHPYYPNDETLPTGHPYENPGSIDHEVPGVGYWYIYQGEPIIMDHLASSTEYKVWIVPFKQEDVDDPYVEGGFDVPAPKVIYDDTDKIGGTTHTTDANPSLSTPYALDVTAVSGLEFTLEWQYSPTAEIPNTYDIEYAINSQDDVDFQNVASIESTTNWGNTTNPKQAVVQTHQFGTPGDIFYFRIRAQKSGFADSAWSNITEHEF